MYKGSHKKGVKEPPSDAVYRDTFSEFVPEDLVDKLVKDEYYQEKLNKAGIYTIRQFSLATGEDIATIDSDMNLQLAREDAKRIVRRPISAEDPLPPLWVYHYLGEQSFQCIKNEMVLKSAFVLYSDYLDLPVEERIFHPWLRVYRAYTRDAAKWLHPKKSHKLVTDLDVYSFLVWRAADSFAKYDCSAGPKAIYFNWGPMPEELRQQCIINDKISAEDTGNHDIADRYSRVIKINLNHVMQHCQGKIYRVEPDNTNKWMETSLLDCISNQGRENLWDNFTPGGDYFQNVPHGCIVTPLGQIPTEYLDLDLPDEEQENLVSWKYTANRNTSTKGVSCWWRFIVGCCTSRKYEKI